MLFLIGLFVIWSNSFHSIAWLRLSVNAWDLVVLRFTPVGIFCVAWFVLSGTRQNLRILLLAPVRIVMMGVLIVLGYNFFLNWGQGRVPAGTASLIIALNPLFTYLLALMIRQESQRWRKTVGLLLSLAGVYLLLRTQGKQFGPGYGLYALSTMGAPLSWAVATILGKPLVARASPLRITYVSLTVGSLFFIPLGLFDAELRSTVGSFTATDWSALLHLSVLCTIVGFAVWYGALRHLPASSVAAFVLLNPPLTILFGPIWGTERPSVTVLFYGAWILAGVLLSTWRMPNQFKRAGSAG